MAFTPLSRWSSYFFFSLFYLFLREEETLEILLQKKSLENGKCARLNVCGEWGVQEREMEFAVVGS